MWEDWIGTVTGDDLTPYIELAKHHEWHTLDLTAARGWAAWALRIAEGWPSGFAREEIIADLRHRLESRPRATAPPSATFATEGVYNLTFTVTDADGDSGQNTVRITVLNHAPDYTAAAPSPALAEAAQQQARAGCHRRGYR